MRQGTAYSRLSVYLPLEDQWMRDRLPGHLRTPGGVWHWEMRHVTVPAESRPYHPLWVSKHYLKRAEVVEGRLLAGQATFEALLVDVEWLDADALADILRLAERGLRVVLTRPPKQPGRNRRSDYERMVRRLQRAAVASDMGGLERPLPLISGRSVPPFFVRRLQDSLLIFFAHPAASSLRYPLEYGQASDMVAVSTEVVLQHAGVRREIQLHFPAYQSLAVIVPDSGDPCFIDIRCEVPAPRRRASKRPAAS